MWDCPTHPGSGRRWGPAHPAPSSPKHGPLFSRPFQIPELLGRQQRSQPWLEPYQSQPPSAQSVLAVWWGLCVTNACSPSPTKMTSDSLRHTGPLLHPPAQALQHREPTSKRAGQGQKQALIPSSHRLPSQPLPSSIYTQKCSTGGKGGYNPKI